MTDETTTPDEPRVSKTDEETVPTVTQFNRHDVLTHPEGRAGVVALDRFHVYIESRDDGTAFDDEWVSIGWLRQLVATEHVGHRPMEALQ
ncbi:hypothetical protein SAMN04487948_11771 [Halogranum amylolyticum]|uniref:Uncharacterized protein n=1 Tax=Halogranum amylolyticum TaxID=660520 RepID=A0A1H8VL84_9EURY|nr:hypothetical protein [Halogranum amylolyticum]SEP15967.1 hypothetical protein SAMN04487948_11771 [Halogranum amylolyticum]